MGFKNCRNILKYKYTAVISGMDDALEGKRYKVIPQDKFLKWKHV
jgi:hypothetical protein